MKFILDSCDSTPKIKVKVHPLETNLRSHDNIVKCAADFISKKNPYRLMKIIKPNELKTEKGDLYKIHFTCQQDEVQWIINKINTLYKKEYNDKGNLRRLRYTDMALLFRKRNDAEDYKAALETAGIPVIYSGMGGLMDTKEVSTILRILQFIGESVHDNSNGPNESLSDIADDVYDIFKIPKNVFKACINDLFSWVQREKRLSLQGLYYKILNNLRIDDILYHNDSSDDVMLYNLGRFSQAISDFEGSRTYLSKNSIIDFIDFIYTHVYDAYDEGETDAHAGLIDAIQIYTMHGTKGLGFPIVFMPKLKGSILGGRERVTWLDKKTINFSRYQGSEVDERRLFYVAMTRAKKFLFITTFDIKIEGSKRTAVHPFFNEINNKYFLDDDIPDQTKRKKCTIDRFDSDLKFPTNYSELSYYLSCNYDYKMRFIYGFNPELTQALGYGKQVHNLINILHKQYERTKTIPTEFEIEKYVDKMFYMRYAADKQKEILKKSCLRTLHNYVAMWKKDFTLCIKTEQTFEYDFENKAMISGSIDMLQKTDHKSDVIDVVDFKTGQYKSHFEENYAHQVILYSIAAQEALGLKISKAYLHYLDDKNPCRQEIIIDQKKISNTKMKLKSAVEGILGNCFKRTALKEVCKKCDWNMICPKNN